MKTFKPGDRVIITRKPLKKEWHNIGILSIPSSYKKEIYTVKKMSTDGLFLEVLEHMSCWYPVSIFELSTPKYEIY